MSDATAAHPAPPHAHLPIDLRWWKQAAGVVVAVPVALYLAYGTTLCAWRATVPPPPPMHVTLANGVEYTREVESNPNRVWHIVKVDLTAEGLSVEGPKADATLALPLIATRPSKAVADNGWVLAFGVGDFAPNGSEGEPVAPVGYATSKGSVLAHAPHPTREMPTLSVGPDIEGLLGVGTRDGAPTAIQSQGWLLSAGAFVQFCGPGEPTCMNDKRQEGAARHQDETSSRFGLGLDAAGKTMYIASIDGRLGKTSVGATGHELAVKLKSLGAVNAAQFAHGDHVSLAAVLPGTTEPTVLNMPSHGGVPGREPALGYMLGIKAGPRL